MEPKDLTGSERKINFPELNKDLVQELKREISDWQEKYRKLEEENKDLNSMLTIAYLDNESLKGKVKELEGIKSIYNRSILKRR